MLVFSLIRGVCFGLEYNQDEDIGFLVNCDLGIFRITWYKDIQISE